MAELGPKMLNTANRALWWVPTIADMNAPKVSEINAGIQLACRITAANYQFGVTGNESISDPALCDDIVASVPGQANVEASMEFFRYKETADDLAWTTFDGKGISGYLVERIGQVAEGVRPEDSPAVSGDVVSVLYGITNDQIVLSPSTAGYEKFRQVFSPQRFVARATVAAGA